MKKIIITAMAILLIGASVFAQTTNYDKGSTIFSIKAGVNFPLVEFYPNAEDLSGKLLKGSDECGLSLGGYASIAYEIFTDSKFAVGGEIGYLFHFSRTPEIFTIVPATAKVTYVPVQTEKFELQLHANAGFAVLKHHGSSQVAPVASLSFTPVYFFSEQWGIGLDAGLTAIAEIYSPTKTELYPATCFTALTPVVISATYRR